MKADPRINHEQREMKTSIKQTWRQAAGVVWTALVCVAGWANAHPPERPVADDGRPLRTDRPGVVFSTTGEAERVRGGAILFRDRRYQLKQWPSELACSAHLFAEYNHETHPLFT